MNQSKRHLPTLEEWRVASRKAFEKLPPSDAERLCSDAKLFEHWVDWQASEAELHFRMWEDLTKPNVDYRLHELGEANKKLAWVAHRLQDRFMSMKRMEPYFVEQGGADELDTSLKRTAVAYGELGELIEQNAANMETWKMHLAATRTNHDALMFEHFEKLVKRYCFLTFTSPADLKLSTDRGPRTHLMNFLTEMISPVPGYGIDENKNLPRRIHDNFWTKLKSRLHELTIFPPV